MIGSMREYSVDVRLLEALETALQTFDDMLPRKTSIRKP